MDENNAAVPSTAKPGHHYVARIKYPTIMQPISIDKIAVFLTKALAAIKQIAFDWTILERPSMGDCFMEIRFEGHSPEDGYVWTGNPTTEARRASDGTVIEVKTVQQEDVSGASNGPISKTEYRIVESRMVFVHYLPLSGPPALSAPSTGQQQASQGTADHASLARKVTTSIRKKTSGLSKGQLATPFNVHDETLDIDLDYLDPAFEHEFPMQRYNFAQHLLRKITSPNWCDKSTTVAEPVISTIAGLASEVEASAGKPPEPDGWEAERRAFWQLYLKNKADP